MHTSRQCHPRMLTLMTVMSCWWSDNACFSIFYPLRYVNFLRGVVFLVLVILYLSTIIMVNKDDENEFRNRNSVFATDWSTSCWCWHKSCAVVWNVRSFIFIPRFLVPLTEVLWTVHFFNVRQSYCSCYWYRLDVCPSHAGIVSKQLNLSSNCLYCLVAPFWGPNFFPEFQWEHPQRGR